MARGLLSVTSVDRGVIATASELFEARHYPGVVAVCTDALEDEPECVPLLLIRGRARVALRRDLEAQADLRDVIRLDPTCTLAYRLLGQLAARCDENDAAAQFFREALRLDPDDREAQDWLVVVDAALRPAAGAAKLPAPAPAAGRFSPRPNPAPPPAPRLARGTDVPRQIGQVPRQANGLAPRKPADQPVERPTQPFSQRWSPASGSPVSLPRSGLAPAVTSTPTLPGHPVLQPPAKAAPRLKSRSTRAPLPELPGFGEYLVASGILTRERLRAAEAYQRSMKVPLSTAIVTLGLATPQRIEWAAVAHQSQVAGDRQR